MQNEVFKKVLAELPEAKDVTYFSDGCASQLKTAKIYSICVNIVLNSELMLNESFLQFLMESNPLTE